MVALSLDRRRLAWWTCIVGASIFQVVPCSRLRPPPAHPRGASLHESLNATPPIVNKMGLPAQVAGVGGGASWSGCRETTGGNWSFVGGAPGQHELNFIHIPRTAGTTIESCSKFFPANTPSWGTQNPNIQGLKPISGRPERCYGQHVPPSMFAAPESPYSKRGTNFCVVRHPYDRLVSQFGFADSMSKATKYTCTPESMNAYLLEQLQLVDSGKLFLADCHFTPESLFVFGHNAGTWRANVNDRWCTHVIRFENLSSEFNKLMSQHGYAVELATWGGGDVDSRHMASKPTCRKMQTSELSPEVRTLADKIYKDDFEAFGYLPTV